MADKILFGSTGAMKVIGGVVQFIPDGSVAEDCDCCGSRCPVCVSYSHGSMDVAVSGFPSSVTWYRYLGIFNNYQVITWSGLDNFNDTYTIETDVDCVWGSLVVGKKVTVNTKTYSNLFCTAPGTLLSDVDSDFTAYLSIGPSSANMAYFASVRTRLTISDPCAGGSDSEFFSLNICPSITGFTMAATWTPTLT